MKQKIIVTPAEAEALQHMLNTCVVDEWCEVNRADLAKKMATSKWMARTHVYKLMQKGVLEIKGRKKVLLKTTMDGVRGYDKRRDNITPHERALSGKSNIGELLNGHSATEHAE